MNENQAGDDLRTLRLVIVDDHPVFRQGVRNLFEVEEGVDVIAEGSSGEEALDLVHQLQPDVIVLDINLPNMNGLQVTSRLKASHLNTRVVLLTAYDDREQVLHAMRSGASAYCPKDIEPELLVDIVRRVANGLFVVDNRTFDEEALKLWLDAGVEAATGPYMVDPGEHFVPLSPREMEILQYVTQGKSNKEIAQSLGISHQTVKNHMTSILKKLDVRDRTQAAVYALKRGWVRPSDADPDLKHDW
ncbi:MAG TPA: response regulator transcription factor [Aggregatilinea sp.]|jgi:DNA-binding NarL/FixJ family response regulator|uniref:response regulator transcription factor n=1 Tax=Aggregatilinea sp. TaxID=2806333 RepID=UPI002BC47556|nr:response regulator transcription factor [Aggregatilinea sp.]HML20045.1 response regulator transcription factor [Aggregatilinea sp.]